MSGKTRSNTRNVEAGGVSPGARDLRRNLLGSPTDAAALVLGFIALAGLLGMLKTLPEGLGFFVGSISIVLFPGMALDRLVRLHGGKWPFPEKVAVWFVVGLASLSVLSFLGILLNLRLGTLSRIVVFCYLALIVAVFVSNLGRKRREVCESRGSSPRPAAWAIILVILSIALAFTTVRTARDNDDWFYLAYITDYLEDQPINSQDAMLGPGWSAPARAWYGSWWVTEALLSRATGAGPVRCHQTYLGFLLLPAAIVGLFTLARRIFDTERAAYLACFLQVVFYLSSAYPTDSAGWGLLSRIAQDKSLAFFVPTMAALAFGLGLLVPPGDEKPGGRRRVYLIYIMAVVAASLIHPLGLVWCAIGLVPIAAVEFLRKKDRVSGRNLVLILIPLVLFGAMLSGAREEAAGVLEERSSGSRLEKEDRPFWDFYLPGERFGFSAGDRTYELSSGRLIAHPLLVTRFPMAIVGLVLTFAVAWRARTSLAARFLVVLTGTIAVLAFVPGVAGVTAGFINERMLYRLTWLFPWGLTIALFLLHLRLKLRWSWLVAIVLTLALARGVPQNYFRTLMGGRLQGRVSPELEEVFEALQAEPTPRGVVLASPSPSLMLPASVSGAYPAYVNPAYTTGGEGERIKSVKQLTRLLSNGWLDEVMPTLEDLDCRYMLIERSRPVANALRRPDPRFREVFQNRVYVLYEVIGLD